MKILEDNPSLAATGVLEEMDEDSGDCNPIILYGDDRDEFILGHMSAIEVHFPHYLFIIS